MTNHYYSTPKHNASTPTTPFGDAKTFHLTLVSAQNLSCSDRLFGGKIKVHAEIQLEGGSVKKTDTDGAGGKSSNWNFDARYPITDSMRKKGGVLVVRLYYKRTVGNTLIGEVEIGLSELFDKWRDSRVNAKACPVTVDQRTLNISYKLT